MPGFDCRAVGPRSGRIVRRCLGGVSERFNVGVLKTPVRKQSGFESLPLRPERGAVTNRPARLPSAPDHSSGPTRSAERSMHRKPVTREVVIGVPRFCRLLPVLVVLSLVFGPFQGTPGANAAAAQPLLDSAHPRRHRLA